jgi:L-ascorbate metabolism protein UlaG (beta-lactamase superfamily)
MTAKLQIRWFGHSCFRISSASGAKILTDPFDESVGYCLPDTFADVVTSSHGHFDHSNVSVAKGNPVVLKAQGEYNDEKVNISSIETWHDTEHGAKRGRNQVFIIQVDGVRIVHMGDIGHDLTPSQLNAITPADVLLVPCGGYYTIDAAGAKRLVAATYPKVVIPMHYKTETVRDWPIATVDEFLEGFDNVVRLDCNKLELTPNELPEETTVYVFKL